MSAGNSEMFSGPMLSSFGKLREEAAATLLADGAQLSMEFHSVGEEGKTSGSTSTESCEIVGGLRSSSAVLSVDEVSSTDDDDDDNGDSMNPIGCINNIHTPTVVVVVVVVVVVLVVVVAVVVVVVAAVVVVIARQ